MTVTTKYDVGDKLYYVEDGTIFLNQVVKVTTESTKSNPVPQIGYVFSSNPKVKRECEIALSKEDLIKLLPVTEVR
jgi:hypothetical protein